MTPPPTAAVLWGPNQVEKLLHDLPFDDGWWSCSALKDVIAGDRLVIYATQTDQDVVAIFDAATDAFKHGGEFLVYGRPKLLEKPILRGELPPSMEGKQGRYYLTDDEQDALLRLLPDVPWQDCPDELPELGDPDWDWHLTDRIWGSETGLSDTIAGDPDAYGKLGYIDPPGREKHPAKDSRRRMDLFGKDRHGRELVSELKHFCGIAALAQLDDYLDVRRAAGRRCAGHLVALSGYSLSVVRAIEARDDDVALWRCWPNDAGNPVFEHIAGPREPKPR